MVKIMDTNVYWGDHISDVAAAANMFNTCPLWTIEYWSKQHGEPVSGSSLCTFILYLLHS